MWTAVLGNENFVIIFHYKFSTSLGKHENHKKLGKMILIGYHILVYEIA